MSWNDLVGHEMLIRLLKGQLKSGRLAHAILFVGPNGVGKRTLALELVKTLQCESPQAQEACGTCEPCRKIVQDAYSDFKRLVPESKSRQIRIDQVRALERCHPGPRYPAPLYAAGDPAIAGHYVLWSVTTRIFRIF